MPRHVLPMDEASTSLAGEQVLDLLQVNVQIVVVLEVVGFGHGAVPWAAGRRAARRLQEFYGVCCAAAIRNFNDARQDVSGPRAGADIIAFGDRGVPAAGSRPTGPAPPACAGAVRRRC